MSNKIMNLKIVLEKNNIEIPIIQRDYAQGRDNKKTNIIRDKFLDVIFESLNNNKKLHLDFVYGSIKEKEGNKGKFIPLDGQQRLTTLFLLYWYFGNKEKKEINFLKKFTYETRASSREFCNNLTANNVELLSKDAENSIKISDYIKNQSWFLAYWENDPTIKSMLNMLDSIYTKAEAKEYKNSKNFFENLDKITFEFFELENFGLDDDLYIKMNARGKQLTDFEIFKAEFTKFLKKEEFKNEKYGDSAYSAYFSENVDDEWTYFFWEYRNKDKDNLIDDAFMNYIYYISEMLHYKDYQKLESDIKDIDIIEKVYKNKENIEFLFKSLDNLSKIDKIFEKIFSHNEYKKEKVALFYDDINLLKKVINNDKGMQYRILLFILIKYISINKDDSLDNLKDLLRVARNLIERIRSNKGAKISYNPTLKKENIHNLLALFDDFYKKNIYLNINLNIERSSTDITAESLEYEVEKAELIKINSEFKEKIFELEDYKYLKGDIRNFITNNMNDLNLYIQCIKEIYNNRRDLIIRAMLSVDKYMLKVGDAGKKNQFRKYFLGKENNWEKILTGKEFGETGKYKEFFNKFFNTYNKSDLNLETIINNYLEKNSLNNRDWRYYFIKYKEMTSKIGKEEDFDNDNSLYIWTNDFGYHVERVNGEILRKRPINPYLRTVFLKLQNEEKLELKNWLFKEYSKEYIREDNTISKPRSYLKVENTIDKFYIDKEGWHIEFNKNYLTNLKDKLQNTYKLEVKNSEKGMYILKEKSDKDLIEIAIDFLKEIHNIIK